MTGHLKRNCWLIFLVLSFLIWPIGRTLATEDYRYVKVNLTCDGCADDGSYLGYNSGGTSYFRVLPPPVVIPPNHGSTPGPANVNNSGSSLVDIFNLLTDAVGLTDKVSLGDFSFIQVGETPNLSPQNIIRLNGQKYLTIAISQDKLPPTLKTVGMTIFDPFIDQQAISFVLGEDKNQRNYSAVIAPLKRAGLYPFNIHIIDFNNQRLKKISGFFCVTGGYPVYIILN